MILAFDMTNSDSAHVPINAALLRAMALSGQRVRMHADPSHLAALGSVAGVECQPMPLSPLYRWKTHIVSLRRFRQANLRRDPTSNIVPPGNAPQRRT
jgi:hypothetical protein